MSEINQTNEQTTDELIEEVEYEVADADVVETPVDPTLTIQGRAAEAKATGEAIRGIASSLRINAVAPVESVFHVYPEDIPMGEGEGVQSLADALSGLETRTGSDILLNDSADADTIAEAYTAAAEYCDSLNERLNTVEQSVTDEMTTDDVDTIFDRVIGG